MSNKASSKSSTWPTPPVLNYGEMNDRIIKFWKDNQIFEKSVEQRDAKDSYVFYDGPPFVTGLPHYGSLLSSIAKDLIPRYQTMKGKKVRRVWGWDCHGLPIENKVENEMKLKNRRDIEKFGLDKFIEGCRSYVSNTSSEWNWYVDHVGRWVDMKNAYYTMDMDFMESVMWVFKQIYDKDLIYQGKRVSLYCPRCGTPVSNFEIAMDNSYKDITEATTTYKFKLTSNSVEKLTKGVILESSEARHRGSQPKNLPMPDEAVYFLAWSTTPWNKIVTTALAVNADLDYILVAQNGEHYILAEATKKTLGKDYTVLATFKGKDLIDLSYEPFYEIEPVPTGKKAWLVVVADFVTAQEGTGIVTLAAYGEDDFKVMQEQNIWAWEHVNDEGIIELDHPLFKDQYYLKVNQIVDDDLHSRGLIYKHEDMTHSVPLCWRCSTRLIYKPQSAWFMQVSKLKDQLKKTNEDIYWFPHHIKHGRFAKGIESAPDWCVSRSRYWATPMPVWTCQCGHRKVLGSIKEIEELSGKKVKDLHRPYIDQFTFPCEKCGEEMHRVEDVLDCWMESGSMPYGERHYPFENKKVFEDNYPADFISEYVAQTRAWFYVMHVISNALFDSHPFKNVICTGVVRGTDGRKMSKSYGNYPDPKRVIGELGGDALRLYLMSSGVMAGDNVNVSEDEIREQNQRCLSILHNVYKYFLTYANLHSFTPVGNADLRSLPETANPLDRWILIRVKQFAKDTAKYLDKYDVPHATRLIRPFVDDLSTWYIRENRDRFVDGDKQALQTLYTVLLEFVKITAPTIPFIAEEIYQGFVNNDYQSSDKSLFMKEGGREAAGRFNTTLPQSVHLCLWPKYKAISKDEKDLLKAMDEVRNICTLGNAVRKVKGIPTRQPLAEVKIKSNLDKPDSTLLEIIKTELNVKKISWQKANVKETSLNYDEALTQDLIDEGNARSLIRKIQQARKKAGTKRDQQITITLPDWPKAFEIEIKKKALVKEIKKGEKLEIIE